MYDSNEHPGKLPSRALGALIGVEAGVFGGLAIIAFMTIVSLAERDPWWAFPNVLATAFYGSRSLRMGAGWPTVSGVALQVLITGVAGAMFGALLARVESRPRRLLLGVIWGLSWFYVSQAMYRAIARLISVYTPELALLGAHAVFGLILGRFTGEGRGDEEPGPGDPKIESQQDEENWLK